MSFLVAEDEPAVQRVIVRALRPFGESRVARTVVDAISVLDETATMLVGAVIDLRLFDGSGMSVIARARARRAALPVMLLSGHARHEDINDAQLHGAEVVMKGTAQVTTCLAGFGRRATAARWLRDRRTRAAIDGLAQRAGLSPGQVAVLSARVDGTTAAATAHALGITERAVRAHIERILAKTGHDRMEDLISDVLRDALSA